MAIAGAFVARLLPLPAGDEDLTPSHHWPAPAVADGVVPAGGPVMILIEYRISREALADFMGPAGALRAIRRRDGAYDWGLMSDASDPEQVTEWFLVGSWEEHLRQHDRVSVADRAVQDRVRAFHAGLEPPRVRHLVPAGAAASSAVAGHLHHDHG